MQPPLQEDDLAMVPRLGSSRTSSTPETGFQTRTIDWLSAQAPNTRNHVALLSEKSIDRNGKSPRSVYGAIATSSALGISSSSLLLDFLRCLDHGCS